jgi:murein DD-endopeptidase MepM/ murein hydrolase activator NlpD
LTPASRRLNNPVVRKAPVTSAALAAALLILGLPATSEARSRQGKSVSKKARAGSVMVVESFAAVTPDELRTASVSRPRRRPAARRPATPVVSPSASRDVAVESVEVVNEAGEAVALEDAGPIEAHIYPMPPCPAEDEPIIEAHVHAEDTETPEKIDAAAEVAPAPRHDSSRIARIARRLGSFFRPKSATAKVRPRDVDLSELLAANFLIPVEGVDRAKLRDSFLDSRGQYARHLAIDIGAPRGTPILATADGQIAKLTREARGGITIYQKDSSGRYLFFYCHLSRYARGLQPGQEVSKGDVIGYVGATGHVIGGAHLHFSITRLPEDDDNLREGLAINPYLLFLAGVP